MSDHGLFRLDGRTIVVFGAASGIGDAVARLSAQQGAGVVAVDVNADGAEAAAGRIRDAGFRAEASVCDITDATQVERLFDSLKDRPVDGVVCTPAINVRKPL